MKPIDSVKHVTVKTYVIGFILSLLLTFSAYLFVLKNVFASALIFYSIIGFGTLQAFIQLIAFLHLGKEAKPRWNLLIFLFMLLVTAIIVTGSLFIMKSLNYRLML